ncbi:cytochrome P450 [Novosphingobium sp. G106]|uniref:cytochrome P450 n=1 Tax=Novosphingobium sp. G106 TaxID=2849500 RepID=UPI001C2DBD65|nr:cytochrome P450 [Novosphingobium sp. G106]MBV1686163.1 cytochrome P450 [Novosphingobium sp. G106]
MHDTDLPAEAIADPRTFTDNRALHGLLARLRRTDPLPYIQAEDYAPFWLVTRHADIMAIERNAKRFINEPRQVLLPLSYEAMARQAAGGKDTKDFMRNLILMDGEEHLAYRAITQSYFTPKGLEATLRDIETLAGEFISQMAKSDGECDFAQIAMPFPLRVIMSMLGVPQEDEPMMMRLTQQTLSSQDPEFQAEGGGARTAMMEMYAYFQKIIADRRSKPNGDLSSVIANARINGEHLSDRDVFGYFNIIATAGHDTTSYSLTGGLLALLDHSEEMAKLRADPSLLPLAVEEILRWTTPVKHFCRTAVENSEVAGKKVKAGDHLLLSYPSASFDETVYEDPFTFRIDRQPNRHLAFGTGPHVCLGQYLARFELVSFFRELIARVEHIELADTPRIVEGSFVGGVKYLPVRYRMR